MEKMDDRVCPGHSKQMWQGLHQSRVGGGRDTFKRKPNAMLEASRCLEVVN